MEADLRDQAKLAASAGAPPPPPQQQRVDNRPSTPADQTAAGDSPRRDAAAAPSQPHNSYTSTAGPGAATERILGTSMPPSPQGHAMIGPRHTFSPAGLRQDAPPQTLRVRTLLPFALSNLPAHLQRTHAADGAATAAANAGQTPAAMPGQAVPDAPQITMRVVRHLLGERLAASERGYATDAARGGLPATQPALPAALSAEQQQQQQQLQLRTVPSQELTGSGVSAQHGYGDATALVFGPGWGLGKHAVASTLAAATSPARRRESSSSPQETPHAPPRPSSSSGPGQEMAPVRQPHKKQQQIREEMAHLFEGPQTHMQAAPQPNARLHRSSSGAEAQAPEAAGASAAAPVPSTAVSASVAAAAAANAAPASPTDQSSTSRGHEGGRGDRATSPASGSEAHHHQHLPHQQQQQDPALRPPVRIEVTVAARAGLAGGFKSSARASAQQPEGSPRSGFVKGPIVGLFDLGRYQEGRDCILYRGQWLSRSHFEKISGSKMAKWYKSIRVVADMEPLGEWLERHGMPVLKGPPRRSSKRPATDSGDDVWQQAARAAGFGYDLGQGFPDALEPPHGSGAHDGLAAPAATTPFAAATAAAASAAAAAAVLPPAAASAPVDAGRRLNLTGVNSWPPAPLPPRAVSVPVPVPGPTPAGHEGPSSQSVGALPVSSLTPPQLVRAPVKRPRWYLPGEMDDMSGLPGSVPAAAAGAAHAGTQAHSGAAGPRGGYEAHSSSPTRAPLAAALQTPAQLASGADAAAGDLSAVERLLAPPPVGLPPRPAELRPAGEPAQLATSPSAPAALQAAAPWDGGYPDAALGPSVRRRRVAVPYEEQRQGQGQRDGGQEQQRYPPQDDWGHQQEPSGVTLPPPARRQPQGQVWQRTDYGTRGMNEGAQPEQARLNPAQEQPLSQQLQQQQQGRQPQEQQEPQQQQLLLPPPPRPRLALLPLAGVRALRPVELTFQPGSTPEPGRGPSSSFLSRLASTMAATQHPQDAKFAQARPQQPSYVMPGLATVRPYQVAASERYPADPDVPSDRLAGGGGSGGGVWMRTPGTYVPNEVRDSRAAQPQSLADAGPGPANGTLQEVRQQGQWAGQLLQQRSGNVDAAPYKRRRSGDDEEDWQRAVRQRGEQ